MCFILKCSYNSIQWIHTTQSMQIAIDITGEKSAECFGGDKAERGFLRGWKFVLICIACSVGPCLLGTLCMMSACLLCHRKVCTNFKLVLCTSNDWWRHHRIIAPSHVPGTVQS
jgi:hypothetical protein